MPIYRNDAYIGGSDWTDAPVAGLFDEFRVYNYALTSSQVSGLAGVYGLAPDRHLSTAPTTSRYQLRTSPPWLLYQSHLSSALHSLPTPLFLLVLPPLLSAGLLVAAD